jgi:hypothetical protein
MALALSVAGCGEDTPYRPLPLTDIGASLGEGFATDSSAVLEGGGSVVDAVVQRDGTSPNGDNDIGPGGIDGGAIDADVGAVPFNDLAGQPTDDGAMEVPTDGGGINVPDTGPTGAADTGPTGPADTGPTGPADTGPTGPADTGPTGPADTGPIGPVDAGL